MKTILVSIRRPKGELLLYSGLLSRNQTDAGPKINNQRITAYTWEELSKAVVGSYIVKSTLTTHKQADTPIIKDPSLLCSKR